MLNNHACIFAGIRQHSDQFSYSQRLDRGLALFSYLLESSRRAALLSNENVISYPNINKNVNSISQKAKFAMMIRTAQPTAVTAVVQSHTTDRVKEVKISVVLIGPDRYIKL